MLNLAANVANGNYLIKRRQDQAIIFKNFWNFILLRIITYYLRKSDLLVRRRRSVNLVDNVQYVSIKMESLVGLF